MRLKGINPFEQHVEKIVVGVVGAVALGVLAWQFVGPANTITVGKRSVELHKGYEVVQAEADELLRRLRLQNPDLPAKVPDYDMLARMQQRMGPILNTRTIAWAGEGRALGIPASASRNPTNRMQVVALQPAAPATPRAAVYLGTVSPAEVAQTPELARFLPQQMPYDKAGISVEATFDGRALRRLLENDPDGDGPLSAYSRHWWDGFTQILAVELHREELQPDGSWSNMTVVPGIPGRVNMQEQLAKGVPGVAALQELAKFAGQNAEFIRRPAYLSMVMGEEWIRPSKVVVRSGPGNQTEIRRELQSLEREEADKARLEEQLAGVPDEPRNRQQRANLQNRIAQANDAINRRKDRIRELGGQVPGDGVAGAAPAGQPAAADRDEAPLLDNPSVTIWAHDITADRGKTYRYRLAVVLPNPLFGQAPALSEESQSYASEPLVRSAPSAWTSPVQVDPETFIFITSAQDQSGMGGGLGGGPRATAELFVFRWGYWRRGTISLRPGDPLIGEVRAPDFAKMMPEIFGGQPVGGGDTGGGAGQGNANPEPIYAQIPVSRDGYLLDVAAVPVIRGQRQLQGGPAVQYQAFLRDAGGGIVVRNPEADRTTPAYQRVVESARLGDEVLRPRAVEAPTGPRGPRGPERPDPAGGKTGGGAGGG